MTIQVLVCIELEHPRGIVLFAILAGCLCPLGGVVVFTWTTLHWRQVAVARDVVVLLGD